jgi:hypothetical protein
MGGGPDNLPPEKGAPAGVDGAAFAAGGRPVGDDAEGSAEAAFDWVFRAAAILANVAGRCSAAVGARHRGLLGVMMRHCAGRRPGR